MMLHFIIIAADYRVAIQQLTVSRCEASKQRWSDIKITNKHTKNIWITLRKKEHFWLLILILFFVVVRDETELFLINRQTATERQKINIIVYFMVLLYIIRIALHLIQIAIIYDKCVKLKSIYAAKFGKHKTTTTLNCWLAGWLAGWHSHHVNIFLTKEYLQEQYELKVPLPLMLLLPSPSTRATVKWIIKKK